MSLATGLSLYWVEEWQFRKIAVIDAVKLFDNFHLKKELEATAKTKLQAIQREADSIRNQLQMAQATRNEDNIKKLSYAFGYIKNTLETEYKKSNQDINEQVWKRLNPAIEEYGKRKGLHIIIGANGMGSVLFNDDRYDLTNDAISYINRKYEEGN